MTDKRRAYWLEYIYQLAEIMGLKQWTFKVMKTTVHDCNCQITLTHNRNVGEVEFRRGWDERAPYDQRQSLVHELIHAQFARTYIFAETSVRPFMSEREYVLWLKALTDIYEQDTDAVASTKWAEMLPLPGKGEK